MVYLRDSSVFDPRFHLVYKDKLVYAAGIDESSVKRILDKIQGEKSVNSLDMAEIILNRISGCTRFNSSLFAITCGLVVSR